MIRHLVTALLLVMVLALPVVGCGASDVPAASRPVAVLVSDSSASFRTFAPDCVPDFATVARAVAERQGELYGGPLVGGDPFGQPFTIEEHFDDPPPSSIEGNDELEVAHRDRLAAALEPDFGRMVRIRAGGSPVLTALERVARFRRDRAKDRPFWIVACTDLGGIEAGVDVRKPISDAEVRAIVARWSGRLRDLAGSDLYVIGARRVREGSAALPASITQVEKALRRIAERVGARVRLVDTQLGQTFP